MALLYGLSSQPTLPGFTNPWWDVLLKKTGHFVVYGVLAGLYLRALKRSTSLKRGRWWLAWGLAALYGLSDEVHQGFVPGRHPALTDWLIDGAGAATALMLLRRQAPESPPGGPAAQS